MVAIDVQQLLRAVVTDVLDADVRANFRQESKSRVHRVSLTSADGERHAGLGASYEIFDATIFDLGVSTHLFDYGDRAEDKEALLRALALVVQAYLRGEGRVERKRGLFRTHPVLKIEVDDRLWELGRRSSRAHYPD